VLAEQNSLREKRFLLLTGAQVSIHHGGKGHRRARAHAMMARKGRQKMPELAGFLLFSLSFHSGPSLFDGAAHVLRVSPLS
jgi:hypothetical protein